MFRDIRAYRYTILARKYINVGLLGLTLILRTSLLVTAVEDVEVVVIDTLAATDIGDEFHE